MYPLIQDFVKFLSICEKYKMDFYPELSICSHGSTHIKLNQHKILQAPHSISPGIPLHLPPPQVPLYVVFTHE